MVGGELVETGAIEQLINTPQTEMGKKYKDKTLA